MWIQPEADCRSVNAAADTAASETHYTRGFVLQSFVSTQ